MLYAQCVLGSVQNFWLWGVGGGIYEWPIFQIKIISFYNAFLQMCSFFSALHFGGNINMEWQYTWVLSNIWGVCGSIAWYSILKLCKMLVIAHVCDFTYSFKYRLNDLLWRLRKFTSKLPCSKYFRNSHFFLYVQNPHITWKRGSGDCQILKYSIDTTQQMSEECHRIVCVSAGNILQTWPQRTNTTWQSDRVLLLTPGSRILLPI